MDAFHRIDLGIRCAGRPHVTPADKQRCGQQRKAGDAPGANASDGDDDCEADGDYDADAEQQNVVLRRQRAPQEGLQLPHERRDQHDRRRNSDWDNK